MYRILSSLLAIVILSIVSWQAFREGNYLGGALAAAGIIGLTGLIFYFINTTNRKLTYFFSALENISETWPVVLPLHPRTRGKLIALNYDFSNSKICFIDPVGYLEMVWLLKNCKMVMTDSGGLQKEAYFFGKYCVTMRNETEWVELVENGFNLLAGSDHDRILQSVKELQEKGQACFENRLYGKGDAGEKVLKVLQTA